MKSLLEKLQAKLRIGEHRQGIREAKAALNQGESVNLPLLNLISSRSWAISPTGLKTLASHARSSIGIEFADFFELRPETVIGADGVAVIHVHGALVDTCPPILEKLGIVTRYATITGDIGSVTAKGASRIILVINSPGGTVSGVAEASEVIARSPVPITAFCSGTACSAAYYLAAGAKEIIATPSAVVGNIGTIISWADESAFWDSVGVEWKALVNDGADLKSTFHLEPDSKQLAFLQESINQAGAAFRKHVEKHRPGINGEVFRAGWYSGDKAKALGLVDAIKSSFVQPTKASPAPSATSAATASPAPTISSQISTTQPISSKTPMLPTSIPQPSLKSKPNPALAGVATHDLVATAKGFQFSPQKQKEALTEIDSREGFFVIESTPFVEIGKFHMMGNDERYRFTQNGGRIAMRPATAADKQGTVKEFFEFSPKEKPTVKFSGDPNAYSFPVKGGGQRSVADFMRFSKADIDAIGDECSTNRGTALRREIAEAIFAVKGTEQEKYDIRFGFKTAYWRAFSNIKTLGPSTSDDGELPATNGGMDAGQLLNLPTQSAVTIDHQANRPDGRRTRREIKKAYMDGSASQKAALLVRFPLSLKTEIHEYI